MKHTQTATYWKATGSYDLFGKPVWGAPTSIKVRWEDNTSLKIKLGAKEEMSEAVIYAPVDYLSKGDYVLLGTSTAVSPTQDAREVKMKFVTPNLRGTRYEYRYVL